MQSITMKKLLIELQPSVPTWLLESVPVKLICEAEMDTVKA